MSQLGLTPPPSDIWDIFEFGTFLKNVDPPPLTKLGHFWISDISYKGNIANYTIKWLRLGHFWKIVTPPLCFQNSQIEIGTFLFFFTPPPIGTLSQIFSLFYFDASPNLLNLDHANLWNLIMQIWFMRIHFSGFVGYPTIQSDHTLQLGKWPTKFKSNLTVLKIIWHY